MDVFTDSGPLVMNSATAKTAFDASSGGALTIKTFTVATASLEAGADLTVAGTGTSSGAMDLRSEGSALFAR